MVSPFPENFFCLHILIKPSKGIVTFKAQEGINFEDTMGMDLTVVQHGLNPGPTSTLAHVDDMMDDEGLVLQPTNYLPKLDRELHGAEEENASEPGWTTMQQWHPHPWESQRSVLIFGMDPPAIHEKRRPPQRQTMPVGGNYQKVPTHLSSSQNENVTVAV